MSKGAQGDDGPSNDRPTGSAPPCLHPTSLPTINAHNLINFIALSGEEQAFDVTYPVDEQYSWDNVNNGKAPIQDYPEPKQCVWHGRISGRLDESLLRIPGDRWILVFDPPDLMADPSEQNIPPSRELTREEACYWLCCHEFEAPPELRQLPLCVTAAKYPRLHRDWQPPSEPPVTLPEATPECPESPAAEAPQPEKSTSNAPTSKDSPCPSKPDIDYDALVKALRQEKKRTQAALVEYMKSRDDAEFYDIKDYVHGDTTISDEAIRKNLTMTKKSLIDKGSPLAFFVAGGRVFKSTRWPVTPGNEEVTET